MVDKVLEEFLSRWGDGSETLRTKEVNAAFVRFTENNSFLQMLIKDGKDAEYLLKIILHSRCAFVPCKGTDLSMEESEALLEELRKMFGNDVFDETTQALQKAIENGTT